jgi:hypothetical protein
LLFAVLLHHPADQQTLAKAKLLDHGARHKGIGPLALEIRGEIPQESIPIGMEFEDTRTLLERQGFAIFLHFVLGTRSWALGAILTSRTASRPPPAGPRHSTAAADTVAAATTRSAAAMASASLLFPHRKTPALRILQAVELAARYERAAPKK